MGSVDAFQQWTSGYDRSVLALALRVTGSEDDARSVYRATFLRLYGSLGSLRADCPLSLHIYRIAADLCLDHLRRRSPSTPGLESLAPHERMVLELKHYHGLTLWAVSQVLDTTEETAQEIFLRATGKLHCLASVNYEQNPSH
jgi:DNA-directed RNA polymerase specialized sigma24 family protein